MTQISRKAFYEREGETFAYNEEMENSLHHKKRLELYSKLIMDQLKKVHGKKAFYLDMGCGEGYVIKHLDVSNNVVVGMDLSFRKLTTAKKLNKEGICFIQADINNLPFKNNAFDLVSCTEVLEHIPDITMFYKEGMRVYNRVFILGAPTYYSNPSFIIHHVFRLILRSKPDLKTLMERSGHYRNYSSFGLLREIRSNGIYSQYELEGCSFVILPRAVYKYFPWMDKVVNTINSLACSNPLLKYFSYHSVVICKK